MLKNVGFIIILLCSHHRILNFHFFTVTFDHFYEHYKLKFVYDAVVLLYFAAT